MVVFNGVGVFSSTFFTECKVYSVFFFILIISKSFGSFIVSIFLGVDFGNSTVSAFEGAEV